MFNPFVFLRLAKFFIKVLREPLRYLRYKDIGFLFADDKCNLALTQNCIWLGLHSYTTMKGVRMCYDRMYC